MVVVRSSLSRVVSVFACVVSEVTVERIAVAVAALAAFAGSRARSPFASSRWEFTSLSCAMTDAICALMPARGPAPTPRHRYLGRPHPGSPAAGVARNAADIRRSGPDTQSGRAKIHDCRTETKFHRAFVRPSWILIRDQAFTRGRWGQGRSSQPSTT